MGIKGEASSCADRLDYIEVFYHRSRRHSTLGYKLPTQFLKDWVTTARQIPPIFPPSICLAASGVTDSESLQRKSEAVYRKSALFARLGPVFFHATYKGLSTLH